MSEHSGESDTLIVVCADPPALSERLDAHEREAVELRRPLQHSRISLADLSEHVKPAGDVGDRLIYVPLDGPLGVWSIAARQLAGMVGSERSNIGVVVVGVDGCPVSAEPLVALRHTGLRPAVDLTTTLWISTEGAWVSGPSRVSWVPTLSRSGVGGAQLARLLAATAPRLDSSTGRWLTQVAELRIEATALSWETTLQALYIGALARRLRHTEGVESWRPRLED
jgi:hypothetical protein